jgi:hypothetical protein
VNGKHEAMAVIVQSATSCDEPIHGTRKEADLPLAIAGTGYGLIGILVIILLVVLIFFSCAGRKRWFRAYPDGKAWLASARVSGARPKLRRMRTLASIRRDVADPFADIGEAVTYCPECAQREFGHLQRLGAAP